MPFLPGDFMSTHGKARTLRLGNLHRFQVSAHLSDSFRRIVSRLRWQGNDSIIFDADYLHPIEINDSSYPFDRVGVAIIVESADPHPGEGSHKAAGRLFIGTVIPGAPGVDHHHIHICNTAFGEGSLEVLVVFEQLFAFKKLVKHDRRLHTRNMLPGSNFIRCEVHYRLICRTVIVVEQLDKSFARYLITFLEIEHNILRWLMESRRDKADMPTELTFFANKSHCSSKLFGCQWL